MNAPPHPRSLATWLVPALVGAWILAGCLLKALLGTPADLPLAIQRAPLAIGTTFALVLGIEAFVGLLMLLRPGRAWPLAVVLLLAFVTVLAVQIGDGRHSCGCFGATIDVPAWAMLAADAALLLLLLWARPWSLPRGGRADLAAVALALAASVALPLLTNREATAGTAKPGEWVPLNVIEWKGRLLSDTPFSAYAAEAGATDGVWLLYRDSCPVCAACLQRMSYAEDRGRRELILVRLPEEPGVTASAVHDLPQGPYVYTVRLPEQVKWYMPTPPARLVVEGGVVIDAREGLDAEACLW